jgi:hypothetical protein
MTHPRISIRNAVKAVLEGYAPLQDAHACVFASRYIPLKREQLPAILIGFKDEEVDEDSWDTAPRRLERYATMRVEIVARELEGCVIDDDIDTLCEHVENAIGENDTLDGTASDVTLVRTDIEEGDDAETVMVAAILSFRVNYQTCHPETTDDLDDFDEADVSMNLGNDQHTDDRANDALRGLHTEE